MAAAGFFALVVAPRQMPARALTIHAAVCTFDSVTAVFTPALPAIGGEVKVRVDGAGSCLFEDQTESDATIGGDFELLPSVPNYSCGGGVGSGSLTVAIDDLGQFEGLAAWVAGPAAAGVVVSDVVRFSAVGAFVRVPGDLVTCLTNGHASMTWSDGAMVFEDPAV